MTAEYVVQMGPMLVLAGLIVAWLAQLSSTVRGWGLVPDMGLGLIGSVTGGLLVWAVLSSGAGMLGMFGIGAVGAVLAIVAQRGLWRSAPIRS